MNNKILSEDLWCWCYIKLNSGIFNYEGGSYFDGELNDLELIFFNEKNFKQQQCNN